MFAGQENQERGYSAFEGQALPDLAVILNSVQDIRVTARHAENLLLFQQANVYVLVRCCCFAEDTGLILFKPSAISSDLHLAAMLWIE
jgi:hypothetical protein